MEAQRAASHGADSLGEDPKPELPDGVQHRLAFMAVQKGGKDASWTAASLPGTEPRACRPVAMGLESPSLA